ncbi:hypothetical protein BKA65DRAFT_472090 [Rhexocercosporidium sp. MPI-PUGE-AT-0058]|nr:hypothetical protein BKA65DRAFT_472090 [Rhexocercosporidium sp. MPI-PUGE-AT-0058]
MIMSAEERAIEFVDEAYPPGKHPACWAHLTLRKFPCRRVNFLYEACGCLSFFFLHSSECIEAGDSSHMFKDDETEAFSIEDLWVAIDEGTCGNCTDLQIITTVDSKPEPPSLLESWLARMAGKPPATVIWNKKTVTKSIPNPKKVTTSPENVITRKALFEARILNQQCERKEKEKRFLEFCDEESKRDPTCRLFSPAMLFPDNEWFQDMDRMLVTAMSQGNPSGCGNLEHRFKY